MKRLLSCYASDLLGVTKEELKQSILSSEGRIIMGETVETADPLIAGVTNAEMVIRSDARTREYSGSVPDGQRQAVPPISK